MSPLSYRQEREASFAQKKAERATVRSHFREKYRLPKVNFQAVLYSTCCMFGWPHRDTLACKHDDSTPRKKPSIDSLLSVFLKLAILFSTPFGSTWPRVRPPQNELDETQIQQAGEDVVLPTELAKMIAEDNQEEAHKQSVLGQLSNLQNVDMDQLKDKAQATLEDLKKQTENCSLMWFGPIPPPPRWLEFDLYKYFSKAELRGWRYSHC